MFEKKNPYRSSKLSKDTRQLFRAIGNEFFLLQPTCINLAFARFPIMHEFKFQFKTFNAVDKILDSDTLMASLLVLKFS